MEVKTIPLDSHVEVLAALRLGWTVRCRVIRLDMPVGGVDLAVHDAREVDEEDQMITGEFQVLTLQGWQTVCHCWGESQGVKVDSGAIVTQGRLF